MRALLSFRSRALVPALAAGICGSSHVRGKQGASDVTQPRTHHKARDVPAPSLARMRLFTAALCSGLGVQAGPGHLPSVLREDTGNSGPPSGSLSPLSGSFWLLSWLSGLPPLLPGPRPPHSFLSWVRGQCDQHPMFRDL